MKLTKYFSKDPETAEEVDKTVDYVLSHIKSGGEKYVYIDSNGDVECFSKVDISPNDGLERDGLWFTLPPLELWEKMVSWNTLGERKNMVFTLDGWYQEVLRQKEDDDASV